MEDKAKGQAESTISSAEISYNDLGQKVLKYRSHGYNITATVKNRPSEEALQAANKAYMKNFYKFNPQDE
ncbi:hypothetical protein [Paenibacillus sp. FSL R5-0908]|uniref:hypothetical protein n=1 Tax=Paenibacillus sp. FSL R5-0908 TaxID=2921664 RepID=UPI0030FD0265